MRYLLFTALLFASLSMFSAPRVEAAGQSCTGENYGVPGTCEPAASCPGNNTDTSPGCPSGTVCCSASVIDTGVTGTTNAASSGPSGFIPLAPIPGLTEGIVASSTSIANFLNNLYFYLVGLAAILAVVEIVWGGLEISTKDSVSKQSNGKERITHALFGLILILSPVLVFSLINPSILNLSIGIPPLQTKSSPWAPALIPATSTSTGNPDQIVWKEPIPCSGNDCSAQKTQCSNSAHWALNQYATVKVVCVTNSGNIDSVNTGSGPKCKPTETLSVECGTIQSINHSING